MHCRTQVSKDISFLFSLEECRLSLPPVPFLSFFLSLVAFAIWPRRRLPPFLTPRCSRSASLPSAINLYDVLPSFLPSVPFRNFRHKNAGTLRRTRTTPTSLPCRSLARSHSHSPSLSLLPLIILARKFLPLHSPMKSGLSLSLPPSSLLPLPTFWPTFDRVRRRPSPLTERAVRARAASTFIFFLVDLREVREPKLPLSAPPPPSRSMALK